MTFAGQVIGGRQPGGAGSDDGHLFAGLSATFFFFFFSRHPRR